MYSRVILTVLFVTLSWSFLGSYSGTLAEAATSNSTNMTSGNMTSGNMTSGNMTSGNMTSGNMTSGNMTSGNMTSGNTTAVPPTTTQAMVINTTVTPLTTPVSREGCGNISLCVSEPITCDPATSGDCFFASAVQKSGQVFALTISGQSDGYIGCVLSTDTVLGGNDTTYVCANNNNEVQFFGALLDSGTLTQTPLSVNSVQGRVNGSTIQCTFMATVPSSRARLTRTTSFSTSVVNGTFNSTTGALGAPSARVTSNVVNLATPNATVTNTLNNSTSATNATTAPPTTAHAAAVHSSLLQSLLVTVVVVGLAMF